MPEKNLIAAKKRNFERYTFTFDLSVENICLRRIRTHDLPTSTLTLNCLASDRLIAGSVINGMRHKMLQSALWKQAGAMVCNEKYGFTISFTYRFRFRFMCRALEAFLLAQMPSNSLLRLDAKAPGYVREPKKVHSIPLHPLNSRLKYADKL